MTLPAFPRALALALIAGWTAPAAAALVINEIDYDQPGADGAEFIELFNSGPGAIGLNGYSLSLINGSTGSPYRSIDLSGATVAGGGYYVICGNAATVVTCDQEASPSSNMIQNGGPDGVALLQGSLVIDALSYEGDLGGSYAEGGGTMLADSNTEAYLGLSRLPGGLDTNDNNADFALRCISPGTANTVTSSGCSAAAAPAPVPEPSSFWLLGAGLTGMALLRMRRTSPGVRRS